MTKKTFRILDERTVTRAPPTSPPVPGRSDALVSDDAEENPYWAWEELPPHPDPSKGCIRRGLCCRSHPGRFGPGEAEKAAELLNMAPDAFVRRYLIIDEVESEGETVQVFAPVKLDRWGRPALPTGGPVDKLYRALRGQCVFFKDNGCQIYGARPWECDAYVCTNAPEDNPSHADVAQRWIAARGDSAEGA